MIFNFTCKDCGTFEAYKGSGVDVIDCPYCGRPSHKSFHATTNFHIPAHFRTSRSDIFTDKEWQDLKKDPNAERAK